MNVINVNKTKNSKVDLTQVGYSDVRLWPCYMIFSITTLLLAPFTGMFLALLIVAVPGFYIAAKIAKIQESDPVKSKAEWKAIHDQYAEIDERDRLVRVESKKMAAKVRRKELDKQVATKKIAPQVAATIASQPHM